MRSLSASAISLLCLMFGLFLGMVLEGFHDSQGEVEVPPGVVLAEMLTPTWYALISISVVTGYVWWADPRERRFAADVVVAVLAIFFSLFLWLLSILTARYYIMLNMGRDLPWYQHGVSLGYLCGMVLIFRKARRLRLEEKKKPAGSGTGRAARSRLIED